MNTRQIGSLHEDLALTFLQQAGMLLVERNVSCRHGEIDLVMRDDDVLVFVEVRYRRRGSRTSGVDSVGANKRARLWRAASVFLARHPHWAQHACRFDVIGMTDDLAPDWRRNAFEG